MARTSGKRDIPPTADTMRGAPRAQAFRTIIDEPSRQHDDRRRSGPTDPCDGATPATHLAAVPVALDLCTQARKPYSNGSLRKRGALDLPFFRFSDFGR